MTKWFKQAKITAKLPQELSCSMCRDVLHVDLSRDRVELSRGRHVVLSPGCITRKPCTHFAITVVLESRVNIR